MTEQKPVSTASDALSTAVTEFARQRRRPYVPAAIIEVQRTVFIEGPARARWLLARAADDLRHR